MIQQNIYSPDQGTQKNPAGNSAFVSKLDPALKQLGSSMKQRSKHETELERSGEQGTRSGGVTEYRRQPVLRQELKS